METIKKNFWSALLPGLVMLIISTVAIIPRLDEWKTGHEKIHEVDHGSELEWRNNMSGKMEAYQLSINTLLGTTSQLQNSVTELKIINQKIENIADTKVRSIQGTQDAQEYRLRKLENAKH